MMKKKQIAVSKAAFLYLGKQYREKGKKPSHLYLPLPLDEAKRDAAITAARDGGDPQWIIDHCPDVRFFSKRLLYFRPGQIFTVLWEVDEDGSGSVSWSGEGLGDLIGEVDFAKDLEMHSAGEEVRYQKALRLKKSGAERPAFEDLEGWRSMYRRSRTEAQRSALLATLIQYITRGEKS